MLLVPETLHDELEVRSLDPRTVPPALDGSQAAQRGLDLPGADLVEDALDELGLDGHCLPRELRVPLGRSQHGRLRGVAVETVQPEGVAEQPGDSPCKTVELGE